MTPTQIKNLCASFAQMDQTPPDLSERFFDRVFSAAPELQALLGGDQQRKLARAVTDLVHRRSSIALPALAGNQAASSENHGRIAITPEYLGLMRMTLIDMVREALGVHFSATVEGAWEAAFPVLYDAMLDGLGNRPTMEDPFFDRLADNGAADRTAALPASRAATLFHFLRLDVAEAALRTDWRAPPKPN